MRSTPDFDAQAALLTPGVQAKADPFAVGGGKSMKPKAGGGPACRVGDAPAKTERKITREPKPPGEAPEVLKPASAPHDIADPAACHEEGLETVAMDEVDDRPDPTALTELANDAANEAVKSMLTSVNQRMRGFQAGAEHLAVSAETIKEEKGAVLAFVEKAFSVVTTALMGIGLARMAANGAIGVLKGLIEGTLGLGRDYVAAKIGEAAQGDEVSFADFSKKCIDDISVLELEVATDWNAADVRRRILRAPYPQREAPAVVEATTAIQNAAHRLQFTSTVTSWANKVNEVKEDDAGVLILDVEFAPSGSFSIKDCRMPVVGEKYIGLLKKEQPNGPKKPRIPLTLGEALLGPAGSLKVTVVDQSSASFTWDPTRRAIITPDNELMYHRVQAWGLANGCKDKVPVIAPHRFLTEVLASKTFGELGVYA